MRRDFFYLTKEKVNLKILEKVISEIGYDVKLYHDEYGDYDYLRIDGEKYYAEIKFYSDTFEDEPGCAQFILSHQFNSIIFVHFQIEAFNDLLKIMKVVMTKYGGYVGSAINDGFLPIYNITDIGKFSVDDLS